MISKKDLERLIESIQEKTGKTQAEIAVQAGYKPNTLTQLLSSGAKPDQAYKRLSLAFREELKISTSAGVQGKKGSAKVAQSEAPVAGNDSRYLVTDGVRISVEEYINQLKKHNDFLERMLETNLEKTADLLQTIILAQSSQGEVVMRALDRLEGHPEGTLAAESGSIELNMKNQLDKISGKGRHVAQGR